MYDISAYLTFTRRKLKCSEFQTALSLCARGRLEWDEIMKGMPEEESPRWRLLYERY